MMDLPMPYCNSKIEKGGSAIAVGIDRFFQVIS
jgi:hypothetical protein